MRMRFVLKGVIVMALIWAGTLSFAIGLYAYRGKHGDAIAAYFAADVAAYKKELAAAKGAYRRAYADLLRELRADRPDSPASENLYQTAIAGWYEAKENLRYLGVDMTTLVDQPPELKYSSLLEAAAAALRRAHTDAVRELEADRPNNPASEDLYQAALARWQRTKEELRRLGIGAEGFERQFPEFKYPLPWEAANDAYQRASVALRQEWNTTYPDEITAEIAYRAAYRRWRDAWRRISPYITGPKYWPASYKDPTIQLPPNPAPPPASAYAVNYAGQ
jgi:hypothetical protein